MSLVLPLLFALLPSRAQTMAEARGFNLLEKGQSRLALQEFRKIIEEEPGLANAAVGLGRAQAGLGQCTEAVKNLEGARTATRYNQAAAVALARCYRALGQRTLGLYYLDEALVLRPEAEAIELQRGVDAIESGTHAPMLTYLQDSEDDQPDAVNTHVAQAIWAWHLGDLDELFYQVEWVHQVRPRSTPVVSVLEARAWLALDDPEVAIGILRAVPLQQDELATRTVWLSEAYRRTGNPSRSAALLSARRKHRVEDVLRTTITLRTRADLEPAPSLWTEAQRLVREHPAEVEVLATAWYIAHLAGYTDEANALAQRHGLLASPLVKDLSLLIPVTRRTE